VPIIRTRFAASRASAVVAFALFAPAALAQPTIFESFHTGVNGWTLYSDGEQLAWSAFAGNPGGAITANDQGQGGYWGFAASPAFLGDRSCFYAGLLRWQFNTTNSGSAVNSQPDATLEGAGLVLVINLANPAVDTWETRTVPLVETAGWRVATLSGVAPTQTQFKSVLADLTAIKLRGEFSVAANDRCSLDNVAFGSFIIDQPVGTSACPTAIITLSAAAQGVGPITHRWQYESAPDVWLDVPEGAVPYAFGSINAANVATDQLTLSLNTAPNAVPIRFRCMVTNSCGSAPSDPAAVIPCAADLNCDGVVDDADFTFFVPAYDILDCADPAMPAGCPADFNGDGVVDDADFGIFVVAYNALGCS
jgi:hypothetical protein